MSVSTLVQKNFHPACEGILTRIMVSSTLEDTIRLAELLVEEEMLVEQQEIQHRQRDLQHIQQDIQQKEHELKQMHTELKINKQELQQLMEQLQIKMSIAKLKARINACRSSGIQMQGSHRNAPATALSHPAVTTTTTKVSTSTSTSTCSPITSVLPTAKASTAPLSQQHETQGKTQPHQIHYEGYSEDETHKHQQGDMIMEAHRQMMTALFLPTPEIPKFRGDPLEFTRFISAFDTLICSRVSKYSDKLYYLEQQLEGEPKESIGGCLFMEPEDGYNEARSLLKCKYGDSVKIAMAYVNKIHYWPRIKDNDPHGLRTLSYILTTCNCAMKRVSYMDMLNHAPNLQVIVTKLPLYLQDEWCNKAYDMIQESGQGTFEDMVKFVTHASDRVNNPIYGLEAMNSLTAYV